MRAGDWPAPQQLPALAAIHFIPGRHLVLCTLLPEMFEAHPQAEPQRQVPLHGCSLMSVLRRHIVLQGGELQSFKGRTISSLLQHMGAGLGNISI